MVVMFYMIPFSIIFTEPITKTNCDGISLDTPNQGGAFNQSYHFHRAGNDLKRSQWTINSNAIDNYALTPLKIFNKDLNMGYNNIDVGSSSLHPGVLSIYHWLNKHFIDICDLTNLSGDCNFWVAGLKSAGSSVNIQ